MVVLLVAVALLLALANGANDNFKGVATLLGSRTGSYRRVLAWATLTTFLGSLAAIYLAGALLVRFQGKGLVSADVAGDPAFVAAVALGAGVTVLIATRIGMPTSTTHALIGGLVGAGLSTAAPVSFDVLSSKFLVPLLASPFVALLGAVTLYPLLRRARLAFDVRATSCFCVGTETVASFAALSPAAVLQEQTRLTATLGEAVHCRTRYDGRVLGLKAASVLDLLHYVSAGATSFARGLNDTPKIAALLLVAPSMGSSGALVLCAIAIALGGVVAARRVARTMSFDVTPMNAGQGFSVNLVTASLVLLASPLGMPVSTTHVSNGALFGLGIVRRQARWETIGRILLTWVLTLPLAAFLAGATRAMLGSIA